MAAIPVPYIGTGNQNQVILGHYGVGQVSGNIAATPTALDPHSSFRWAPSVTSYFAVLMRLKVGWAVQATVTAAVRIAYQASIAHGWTTADSSGTFANMASPAKTNQMRGTMGMSQMGTSGPQITTTGALTAGTRTLDANPFAITVWDALHSVPLTSTAAQLILGSGGPMQPLYEWTALGQHPPVFANQEGVVVQLTHTGWATGVISLYTHYEWGEALVF